MSSKSPASLYPYLLYYKPSLVALIAIGYVSSYAIFVSVAGPMGEVALTLVFPIVFFLSVMLMLWLNNLVFNKSVSSLTQRGYFQGAIPRTALVNFVNDVNDFRMQDGGLAQLFEILFSKPLAQVRLSELEKLGVENPEKFFFSLIKENRVLELDRIIKYYSDDRFINKP